MIHYACDRCKRVIDPEGDVRYVVRLEVQAMMGSEEMDDSDDQDQLLEIHEILERIEDDESEVVGDDVYQRRRYDLCASCHRKFIQNPVGQEAAIQLGFSQN